MLPAPSAVRVVLDTNTAISGLLWDSTPRRLLEAARHRHIELFTSPMLLAELSDVLPRPKFAAKIAASGLSADELVRRYAQLSRVVSAADIRPVVASDPDDDAVIACAIAAQADFIVSGDKDLRNLKRHAGIAIVSAADLEAKIRKGSAAAGPVPDIP